MYLRSRIKDEEALGAVRNAVAFLLRRATLCGLCLLDEAIQICELHGIPFAATDFKHIFYNPEWVKVTPVSEVAFVLLHEWMHIFLRHDLRQGTREGRRWNYATDYALNPQCALALKMDIPSYLLVPTAEYQNKEAEAIYELLRKPIPPDEQLDIIPTGEDPGNRNTRLREMAERASLMLKDRPPLGELKNAWVQERLGELTAVILPWDRMWLSNIYKDLGGSYIDYRRPKKAYLPVAWLPRNSRRKSLHLFLAIDISGSMRDEDVRKATFVLDRAAKRADRITVVTFDSNIREHFEEKNPSEVLKKIKFKQGAHRYTSTLEVFALVEKTRPSSVSIITDGYVGYPEKPFHDVNWILTKQHTVPPWGRKFVMQDV